MTLPEIDIVLIEKYIDGILSDSEKRLFDEKYVQNPLFKHETDAYKKALEAIKIGGRQNIMAIFAEEEAKIQKQTPVIAINTFQKAQPQAISWYKQKWAAIAASIAVIAVAAICLMPSTERTGQAILAQIAITPTGNTWTTNVRSARSDKAISDKEKYFIATYGEKNTELLILAFQAYTGQDYAKAAATFSEVTAQNDSLHFYKGISYLKANMPVKAIESLKIITDKDNADLKQQAEWFLLLAYLGHNDIPQAKVLQAKILNMSDHKYKEEATNVKF